MVYLIDSNTFMTAARTFYSFDYGPKFWDFIEVQAKNNALASIDREYATELLILNYEPTKSIITAQVDFAGLGLYNYGITKGG